MKALLLAAGYGTRLRPITDTVPKCMVPLGHKPLLAYWLEALSSTDPTNLATRAANFEKIVVNTHYLPQVVESFIDASPWRNKVSLLHEKELLGTAGTLRASRTILGESAFLMAHADNASRFSLSDFLAKFNEKPAGCIGTMMTFKTSSPRECGIVEIDTNGILVNYFEKVDNPPSDLANAAVFIFEPEIHEILKERASAKDFCAEVVPYLVGKLNTFHNNVYHRDVGTPIAYHQALQDFA